MSKSCKLLNGSLTAVLLALVAVPPAADAGGRVELGTAPSTPVRARLPRPAGVDEQAAQKTILASYRALGELARAGGADLGLQVGDFRTFQAAEMDAVLWLDLVTMPEGRGLDVTRRRHTDRSSGAVGVAYRAAWRDLAAEWVLTGEGQELIGSTAAEVLARAARSDSELAEAIGVTSYEVTVSLSGEERTYRAAFLWLAAPSGRMRFRSVDLITQGVENALTDRASAVPAAPAVDGTRSVSAASGTCYSWTTQHPASPPQVTNANDHISGHHYAQAAFNVQCECTSTCESKCQSAVTSSTCEDTWSSFTVSGCHRQGTTEATQSHTNANGVAGGAECTAGWGCAVKACVGCLCTVSITVSISDAGEVELASDGNVWAKSLEHKVTCAPCSEVAYGGGIENPGPFHRDPEGGGGGTGGGGWSGSYGGGCTWFCTTSWDGSQYSESCTLIC
ncbi:MAG TPA: hypothetical protein VHM02_01820 [Thermoanaerobaculia bacterium]|nr:hypothetical protein [Thermoanaerobaculia bacterium]